jgi:(p)ppGpp synthase/HD superfamily hydrolase
MYSFAQTNIQLFQQLSKQGYSNDEILQCHQAYQLTASLFSGYFRADGKTFIAHLVGTASILASIKMPITVVNAGLLHAAYLQGNFGDETGGISKQKREFIKAAIGDEVENYIAEYTNLEWTEAQVIFLSKNLSKLNLLERNVLLMRLVNELEDHLDLGILYCANAENRLRFIKSHGESMIKMLKDLGFPQLATELATVLQQTFSGNIVSELQSHHNYSFLIPVLSTKALSLLA